MLQYDPMRLKSFVLIVLIVALFASGVQAQDGDLLARINSLRAKYGLPGYSINGSLTAAAQQQAQWIVDNATIAHTHPDGSGPRSRALAAGYPSLDVGE